MHRSLLYLLSLKPFTAVSLEQMAYYISLCQEEQRFGPRGSEVLVAFGTICHRWNPTNKPVLWLNLTRKNQRCSGVNPGSWYATARGTEREALHRQQCESVDRTSEQDMA